MPAQQEQLTTSALRHMPCLPLRKSMQRAKSGSCHPSGVVASIPLITYFSSTR